ncbi:MAG: Crp/Fnr family transcriptional regulator [Symbiopectobacterium sp.]|uniref:Crp/Fnr family transcriptional regulator n=1 Tax=Symbiopectobacterium sp. TaxID=2952789 RepID=UPI0039EB724D
MTFVKMPIPTAEHCEVLLFSHPWLRDEPEEVVLALQSACCRIRFQTGDMLFREGDRMRYCPLVEHGELQAFRHTYQGDDKVLGQFVRGEWVALAAVFMEHGRFPMNIRALSAGQAMLIPRETLHQFCLQRPTLALQLLGNLSQKLYATINQIDWLTSSSAGERLADYLLRLHRTQQGPKAHSKTRRFGYRSIADSWQRSWEYARRP